MSKSEVVRPTGTLQIKPPDRPGEAHYLPPFRNFWPLTLIAACYVLSRVFSWALGVRFASLEVESMWQFLDTSLLRHQLWISILYLHSQPPLMNLFYGILLKIFPIHWSLVAYGINLLLGQIAWMTIYILLIKCKVSPPLALGVVIAAMCNPSAVVYEAEPFYTHTVFFLLVISAYLFENYLRHPTIGIGAAFLAVLTVLVLWRSSYQILWYALYALWLVKITPPKMFPKILTLALLCFGILGSIYIKNGLLMRSFSTSSCAGMSLAKAWASENATSDIVTLIRQKKLSPISSIPPYSAMDKYMEIVGPFPKTGVIADDEILKGNGSINLNNIGYVQVSKLYTRDYLRPLKLSPLTIAHQIGRGWLDYFRPNSVYLSLFDPQNQSSVEVVDRWYRIIFCTGASRALNFAPPVDDHRSAMQKLLGRLESVSWQVVFIYGLLAVFLACSPFRRWITAEKTAISQLLLFSISNITWSALLSNTVEVAENMRYRYETQGLALIAGTIICQRILQSALERSGWTKG